ncbi:MAG: hypothetical protein JSV80_07440 [Acidobacteriota bacterium]|nr:MAG: hypothetical protein JSV80_07440 [Acidobacteriota bacterium]
MRRRARKLVVLIAMLLIAASGAAGRGRDEARARALLTVEGEVIELDSAAAEGGLSVVMVTLSTDRADLKLLLAPAETLAEIGFEVRVGDALRAHVFRERDEATPLKVHRVLNMTAKTMVRLRTLHLRPVWNDVGAWRGGDCRPAPEKGREAPGPRGPGPGGRGGGPGSGR